ncbi:MAG: hypothetical protein FJ271_19055 [Planctomycetes bacterium]|nr:hypothetical protein [Planctomycetota bacterium]
MRECRSCREWLRGDPAKIGARCPRCRQPLYERPEREKELEADKARCPTHPGRAAVGPCTTCGAIMCSVCRSRWNDKPTCVACAVRARIAREHGEEDAWNQGRQAGLSVFLSVGGWVMVVLALIALAFAQDGVPKPELAKLGKLTTLASMLPALFALGLALSAIRARGPSMTAATTGFLLAATQLGLLTGLLLLSAWHY